MIDLGTMKLRCPGCGGEKFLYPPNANLDSQARCAACERAAPVRDIVDGEEALRLAAERIRQAMR